MLRAPDQIPENIDFAAQELLEAPEADRLAHAREHRQGAHQALAEGRAGV
jgi:hypothetical protein